MGSSCGFVKVPHHALFLLCLGFILLLVECDAAGTLGWVSATGLLCSDMSLGWETEFSEFACWVLEAAVLGLRQSVRFPSEGQQCVWRQGCVRERKDSVFDFRYLLRKHVYATPYFRPEVIVT